MIHVIVTIQFVKDLQLMFHMIRPHLGYHRKPCVISFLYGILLSCITLTSTGSESKIFRSYEECFTTKQPSWCSTLHILWWSFNAIGDSVFSFIIYLNPICHNFLLEIQELISKFVTFKLTIIVWCMDFILIRLSWKWYSSLIDFI